MRSWPGVRRRFTRERSSLRSLRWDDTSGKLRAAAALWYVRELHNDLSVPAANVAEPRDLTRPVRAGGGPRCASCRLRGRRDGGDTLAAHGDRSRLC